MAGGEDGGGIWGRGGVGGVSILSYMGFGGREDDGFIDTNVWMGFGYRYACCVGVNIIAGTLTTNSRGEVATTSKVEGKKPQVGIVSAYCIVMIWIAGA